MEKIKDLKTLKRALFSEKTKISEKKLFLSKTYQEYLITMVKGFLPFFKGSVTMYEGGDEVAFTEGNNNFININSPLVKGMSIKEKNKMFKGLNLHEIGHMLFTDFALDNKIREKLEEGIIYPKVSDEDVEAFIARSEHNKATISQMLNSILNIVEDGYVDRIMGKLAPGYAPYLKFLHQNDLESMQTYKQMQNAGECDVNIFLNSLLMYARFGKHTYTETESSELIDEIKSAEEKVKEAVFNHSPIGRAKNCWEILFILFNFVKKDMEKKEEEKDGSEGSEGSSKEKSSDKSKKDSKKDSSEKKDDSKSSGKSDSKESGVSDEMLSEMLSKLSGMMPKEDVEHKEPSSPSAEAISMAEGIKESEEETEKKDAKPKMDSSEESELDKLKEEIALDKIKKDQEKAIKVELDSDLSKDATGVHDKVKSKVIRKDDISERGKKRYDDEHKALDQIVTRFVRDFLKEINERKIGDEQKGLYFGKRLTINEVYRKDKRIFKNIIAPEEIPDMAVGILVDLSGSMMGERESMARKCAYVTYEFCQKLEIPCFVIGHDVDFSTGIVRIHSAADESSIDKNDAKRIMDLEAHGDNRDGYALRYCYRKLERMSGENKVMFVISDGAPQDSSSRKTGASTYTEVNGGPDLRNAVSKAKKLGIETIVAGIGSDAPRIKEVYKKGMSDKNSAYFIDISDLAKLPKAFIKILKVKLS